MINTRLLFEFIYSIYHGAMSDLSLRIAKTGKSLQKTSLSTDVLYWIAEILSEKIRPMPSRIIFLLCTWLKVRQKGNLRKLIN